MVLSLFLIVIIRILVKNVAIRFEKIIMLSVIIAFFIKHITFATNVSPKIMYYDRFF